MLPKALLRDDESSLYSSSTVEIPLYNNFACIFFPIPGKSLRDKEHKVCIISALLSTIKPSGFCISVAIFAMNLCQSLR